jgi:REP element-mobilizing transposase RayT
MSRPRLIRTDQYVYHITTRSNSKEWFYLPSKEVWKISTELLGEVQRKFSIEIYSFVLMSNHYHFLVRTPEANIDKVMAHFNKKMSDRINSSAGRTNIVFGGRYKWNIITKMSYYMNAYKYVYQNPIAAKICKKVEEYPYSTLRAELGWVKLPFIIENWVQKRDIAWLNERYLKESNERILNCKKISKPLQLLCFMRGLRKKSLSPSEVFT